MDVAAIIVTRGDVDVSEPLDTLRKAGIGERFVWDNSQREDLGVYGRYAAIEHVEAPVIFVQDDDCVLPVAAIRALLAAYEPGVLTANLPRKFYERYKDRGTCMVGFGAVFDRGLPMLAFEQAICGGMKWTPELFNRTCDLVFAGLTPHKTLDLPYTDQPWARDESRMWRQPGHFEERLEMINLVRSVRDGMAA